MSYCDACGRGAKLHYDDCEIGVKGKEMNMTEDRGATGAPDDDEAAIIRLETDPIGELCRLVKETGLTMTLYGQPISETSLRERAMQAAIDRFAGQIVEGKVDRAGARRIATSLRRKVEVP